MRKIITLITICIVIFLYAVGYILSASTNHPITIAPKDLEVRNVNIGNVKGWLVEPNESNGNCVLLMHGVRADRTSMIEHAKLLKSNGYVALLFDFQGHGESIGEKITFGYLESKNAAAALEYMRNSGKCNKIGLIGHSLGGAASLLGDGPIPADAFILEAVYPTIEEAVSNRLAIRLGNIGRFFAPLITYQIPLRWNIQLQSLRPILAIKNLKSPVLIIAGSIDEHTSLSESKALYNNAPEPKELWIIEGAAHVDFYSFSPKEYKKKILGFFDKYLKNTQQPTNIPDNLTK